MNNYHNLDVTLEESWDLAIYVKNKIWPKKLKLGEITKVVDEILSNSYYVIYNRNALEVALEKWEIAFMARNERIEPSGSGI